MYNRLFTKILDSSIWLENDPTRLVWITMLASMDEDGFVCFASVKNLARRAIVSEIDASKAVLKLESPDPDSGDPDNEGRRIEKVTGGWIVLNSSKYGDIINRQIMREKNRVKAQKYREKNKSNHKVTDSNQSLPKIPLLDSSSSSSSNSNSNSNSGKRREESKTPPARSDFSEESFWEALQKNPAYRHTNLEIEKGKMVAWLSLPKNKNRKLTRQFALNWLNKIETPLEESHGKTKNSFPRNPSLDALAEFKRRHARDNPETITNPLEISEGDGGSFDSLTESRSKP